MKQDASIRKRLLPLDGEVTGKRMTHCGLGEVRIDRPAAAKDFDELGVGGRYPFQDDAAAGNAAEKRCQVLKGDLTAEQNVMHDREHHDCVEVVFTAREE